jgi:hypothetical protein
MRLGQKKKLNPFNHHWPFLVKGVMKLLCPNCGTNFSDKDVNIQEGIAHCDPCQENFKIANFLLDNEVARRMSKPDFSNVTIESDNNSSTIVIPAAGWTRGTIATLVIAVFWNAFNISWILLTGSKLGISLLVTTILGVFGIVLLFQFFNLLNGKTIVFLDKHNISAYRILFGINHGDIKSTKALTKIIETIPHGDDDTHIPAIAFVFKDSSQISFGSQLTKEERKWLIGELNEMQKIYLPG